MHEYGPYTLDDLDALPEDGKLRIDWSWTPSWSPRDVTPAGREQLTAIGFSFGAADRRTA